MGTGPGTGGTPRRAGINIRNIRNLRTFLAFKNPVYRLYYGGMLGQMASMNMQMVARSYLIYRITGSATVLGAMNLANAIPMLCLSLFGGAIADQVQKKYVLLAGQAVSAVLSLGVALALTFDYLSAENTGSWWVLIVTALFQGAVMGLMMPSRQAIISEIVGEQQLMNAISLNTMGMNTLQIIAPAVTGFLIDAAGFEAAYYSMTGMYLVSVTFFYFMPLTSRMTIRGGGALSNIKGGIKYLRGESIILMVLLISLFMVLLSMPYSMLMPVFAEDILKVGASGMGILMSVSGVGAIVGSITLASLPNRKRGVMLLGSGILLGLALTGFSFSKSWPLSLGMIVFVGLGQTGRMTLSNTLVQYYVNSEYLGRVMSIFMMQFGLTSFGTFLAGVLSDAIGAERALGGFAIALIVFSLVAIIFFKRIRQLE